MPIGRLLETPTRRVGLRRILPLTIFLAAAPSDSILADGGAHRLQGLFCNTEHQIDETIGYMRNLPPRAAVALTNNKAVVCTYADLLDYAVDHPVIIGEVPGIVGLIKYEALLVGVVVGGKMRAVTPPARVFFVAPQRLEGAALERRAWHLPRSTKPLHTQSSAYEHSETQAPESVDG